MDPFTEVRKLTGRASHDGSRPPPSLPTSVNLPAQWPESACARVRRVGARGSSLELGGCGGFPLLCGCSSSAVALVLSCRGSSAGKVLSLSSVAVVKRPPVSPGYCTSLCSGPLGLPRVRWGPDETEPFGSKSRDIAGWSRVAK